VNKPNWKDAPDWAMWLTLDIYGCYTWWSEEPYEAFDMFLIADHEFTHRNSKMHCIGFTESWDEPRGTLEPRPTVGELN